MTTIAQVDVSQSVEQGFTTVLNFIPSLLAFIAILIIGYLVARVLQRVIAAVLERVGFDRAVERGGVKRALARTRYDASDLLGQLVFYAIMLLVLQMAFGVFGPNPISALLFGIIAFLPKIFVAVIIVVVASAIAAAVREIIDTAVGSLSYGALLANAAAVVILAIGIFAALNQIEIAPAIVNGLFYALLAAVVGVVVVAVGGGGIQPMRGRWESALSTLDQESGRIREEVAATSRDDVEQRMRERSEQFEAAGDDHGDRNADRVVATQAPTEPVRTPPAEPRERDAAPPPPTVPLTGETPRPAAPPSREPLDDPGWAPDDDPDGGGTYREPRRR